MNKDEFYIGWQDEPTNSHKYKQGRRLFFSVSLLLILLFGVVYLSVENKFVDNYYGYGYLITMEGVVVEYPVFGLRTKIEGKEETVPLVGFGKFDALPVLTTIKERAQGMGTPLANLKVTLKGTILTYQNKTWMELTEGNESIISMEKGTQSYVQNIVTLNTQTISGEIVDPKCFFGAMNPAYSKIHRSCAIRCISGGIPPVLAIREQGVFTDYYFVVDQAGQPLNQSILQYVGMPLTLSGSIEQVDDWKLIKVNIKELAQVAMVKLDSQLTFCSI